VQLLQTVLSLENPFATSLPPHVVAHGFGGLAVMEMLALVAGLVLKVRECEYRLQRLSPPMLVVAVAALAMQRS